MDRTAVFIVSRVKTLKCCLSWVKKNSPSKKSDETLLRICIQYSKQNIQNTAAVFSVRQTVGIIADQVEGGVPCIDGIRHQDVFPSELK